MMRLAAILVPALALAACSSSSRVDGVVPAWGNTPPHTATSTAATKRAVAGSRSEPQTQGVSPSAPAGEE